MFVQRYTNKSSRKQRNVRMKRALVQMLDGNEIDFFLEENCKGGALFNSVCTHLDLMERCYFGICYRDQKKNIIWLKYDIKISKQIKRNLWNFELHVKFYPPNPNLLQEEITRYYLCLQLRQDLCSGRLPCSFGIYILLGAYVIQSELGDFDPNNHNDIEYLRKIKFAVKNSQNDELLSKISDLHKSMRGLTPEEADANFLSNAKKMSLYGIEMHKVMSTRDDEPFLVGVYFGGIVVHKGFLRINRIIWPRILKFSYKKNIFKLIYKDRDSRTDIIKYYCSSQKFARMLWLSCAECHSFFRMRESDEFKSKSLFKKSTQVNVGLTLYQTQRTIFERTPPQFKRHPVTEAVILSSEIDIQSHDVPLEICNDNFKSNTFADIRPTMISKFIRFSHVDKSDMIRFNSNYCLTMYTCKNLDNNDNEWYGCRTNWGIRKVDGDELLDIIYFEMYVISQGTVKISWSTNNCNFNMAEEYGCVCLGDTNIPVKDMKIYNMLTSPFGPVLNSDDVIGCYFDISSQRLWWKKNNDEVSEKISIPEQILEIGLYPTISLKNGIYKFNFGKEPFKYDNKSVIAYESVPKYILVDNIYFEWSLNQVDEEHFIFYNNGEIVQCRLNIPWQGIRTNHGLRFHPGCYYFEVTQLESRSDSLAMLGWTVGEESNLEVGSHTMSWGYGADRDGFGLNGNQGKKMHDDEIENYGKAFRKDDIIGCFINLKDYSLSWSLNGVWFGVAYQMDESLITSSNFIIFPTFYLRNNTIEINFGYRKFHYTNIVNNTEYLPLTQAPLNNLNQSEGKVKKIKQQGFSYANPGDILNIKLKSRNILSNEVLPNSDHCRDYLMEETNSFSEDRIKQDVTNYKKIPTIPTKAIRFPTQTDSISEEFDTNNISLLNTKQDNESEFKDKFPIVLTKTSYFRYGEINNNETDQSLLSNNAAVEICSLKGKENIEKRINELTSSIHRRSSGAEGGDIREVTLFKSKTKDRTQAAVIRHIVIDTDLNDHDQDLKQ